MTVPPVKKIKCEKTNQESVVRVLGARELGKYSKITTADLPQAPFKLPIAWRKKAVNPGLRNKIFASQWITDNHIVYGTKCNQLVLHDCSSDASWEIPLIGSKSGCTSKGCGSCVCGIHAIQTNPSKSLLATGGANVNHVGIYGLSELSPVCLLENCHSDWVFDLRWLDDSYLVSCSRDSSLALWRIPTTDELGRQSANYSNSIHTPQNTVFLPSVKSPVCHVVSAIRDDRFRAVEHLPQSNLLTVLSMSRRVYLYDTLRMGSDKHTRPIFTLALRDAYQEAVALRRWPSDPNCVALATHYCVVLFDIRCSNPVSATGCCIDPPRASSGVRSLNFSGNLLSYGCSNGQVHFYDLRAKQHLPTYLDVGPGWVKSSLCLSDDAGIPSVESLARNQRIAQSRPPSGWGAPPPTPQPIQSIFLPHMSMGDLFASHASNLRVRLNRRQQQNLSLLRNRRFASLIYSIAGVENPEAPHQHSANAPDLSSSFGQSTMGASRRRRLSSTELIADVVPLAEEDTDDESESDSDTPMNEVDTETDEGESVLDLADQFPARAELSVTEEPFETARPPSNWRLPTLSRLRRTETMSGVAFPLTGLLSEIPAGTSLSDHRRQVAVYTHEYDPSGTRLFTAGGPIASTYHGNVAALWE